MHKEIILISFFSVLSLSMKGQSTLPGETDNMRITLKDPNGRQENVTVKMDNRSKDEDDHANPTAPADNVLLDSEHYFSTLVKGDDGNMIKMFKDTRPYKGRFSVDFPIYVKPTLSGSYSISIALKENLAATIIRLIDKENPNTFINLIEGPYTFNVSTPKEYADRFIVRVYAACLFKKNAENNNWANENNWVGNLKPGFESDARINNCVIIPSGTSVDIPQGNTLSVSVLLNSGNLSIQKGSSLTVTDGVKLVTTDDLY